VTGLEPAASTTPRKCVYLKNTKKILKKIQLYSAFYFEKYEIN